MFGIPYLHIFITVPILVSERPPAFNRVSVCVRLRLVPRSVVPRPAFAERNRDCGAKVRSKVVVLVLRAKWAAVLTPAMLAVCTPKTRCFRFCSSPVFFLQSLIGASVPSVWMLLIRCILGVKSFRNMISMALLLVE